MTAIGLRRTVIGDGTHLGGDETLELIQV